MVENTPRNQQSRHVLGSGISLLVPAIEERLIAISEIVGLTGLSRSTIFRKELEGTFPSRVKLSARRVGWRLSDVMNWVDSLKSASNSQGS